MVIRKFINRVTDRFVRTSAGYYFNKGLYRLYEYFRFRRSLYEHQEASKKLEALFPDLTVKNGLMAGLKYPSFSSFGSSIYPKLGGTYENELTPFFYKGNTTSYKLIIDIGCAEGYYAVGLARKYRSANIIAFDTDESARKLCYDMAVINGVQDRIQIFEKCTDDWISSLDPDVMTLLICDCEGYERHLFNQDNINALRHTDLVIELHPMHEPDVKVFLSGLLSSTHQIEMVSSYDDKRKIFDLPEQYGSLSELGKLKLVQEGRSFSMDWLIATANPGL